MTTKQSKPENLGVLMLDFIPVVREGLKAILTKDGSIEVIGDASDGYDAILNIKRASDRGRSVNVVLTETRNDKVDGVQATRSIKDEFPDIAVLVLTENLNDSYVIDAIHAGAGGYIFIKDMTPEFLLQSIHQVVEAAHLTAREVDVLRLMGNGDSNKIIAETLGITLDTTKKHVRNVIDKMEARSRTHASMIAAQAGLVGNPVTPVLEGKTEPWLAA